MWAWERFAGGLLAETDRYYYDGVRRICEDNGASGADPAYVWGVGGVDDILAKVVATNYVYPYTTDENGNVVGYGQMLEHQYVYTPYGEVLRSDVPVAPHNNLGHQGLFAYRLDGAPTDDALEPGATVLYYNRNRWYSPSLGRFTSRDPNETTQPVVLSAYNGTTPYAGVTPPAIEQHYGDGLNLFAAFMSNPVRYTDPMGLAVDPFDEIDAVIADIQGSKAAAAAAVTAQIGMTFNVAKLVGEFALSMMPGHDAVMLMKAMYSGEEVSWDMILFAGLDLAGPLGKIGGKAFKYAAKYADKLGDRARMNMSRNSRGMMPCNCFIAGTPVDTPDGPVPIEAIEPDDEVLTKSEQEPFSQPQVGKVSRVFQNFTTMVMWLTLSNGTVLGTTPGHEVWTFEHGWTVAAGLEEGDRFMGRHGQALEITGIHLDPTPTTVYNFVIDGTYTYFVDGVWVHNNSCPIWSEGKWSALTGNAYEKWALELFGFTKYTGGKLNIGGKNFVPDIFDKAAGIIGDVKDVKDLAKNSGQLKRILEYAKTNGLKPVLIVSGKTDTIPNWIKRGFDIIDGP